MHDFNGNRQCPSSCGLALKSMRRTAPYLAVGPLRNGLTASFDIYIILPYIEEIKDKNVKMGLKKKNGVISIRLNEGGSIHGEIPKL